MKTAILYYSKHHGNTKKLIDAIKAVDLEVNLIDVTVAGTVDLSGYDRIGIASDIYYTNFARQVISFASNHLQEGKLVFFIYTHGAPKGGFLKGIREITKWKHCKELGEYRCQRYDIFGPFKIVGGIAKGHPTKQESDACVKFYQKSP